MDDHQTGNAMRLVDKGAAIMMAEADIDAETLAKTLATLIQETKTRETMAGAARALGDKDAALNIARLTGLSLEDADEAPANEIGSRAMTALPLSIGKIHFHRYWRYWHERDC